MTEAAHICDLAADVLKGHLCHPHYHRIGLAGIQVRLPVRTSTAAAALDPGTRADPLSCAHALRACAGLGSSTDDNAGLLWLHLSWWPVPGCCGHHVGEGASCASCQAATAALRG